MSVMERAFTAWRIHQDQTNFRADFERLCINDLSQGEVIIEVAYSAVNYKDALAATGKAKILRHSPLNGGIDLAGTVVESQAASFKPGDEVLAQGSGLGEIYDGGYARYARLPAEVVLPCPDQLSTRDAAVIGTAGFTAMLCIESMERNRQTPEQGPILVTGASGGVGSFALRLLGMHGYHCTAASRKHEDKARNYMKSMGAAEIIDPPTPTGKAMASAVWGGVIDSLGGEPLVEAIKATKPSGNVVSVGLACSAQLSLHLAPFIVRGVNLLGVSSANCPIDVRRRVWQKLGATLADTDLSPMVDSVLPLAEIKTGFRKILNGQVCGRVLVDLRNL